MPGGKAAPPLQVMFPPPKRDRIMSILHLLGAELFHRKANFVLSVCAIIAAATMFVAGPTLLQGYQNESRARLQVMRDETHQQLEAQQQETDQQLAAMQAQQDEDLAYLDKRTKRIMRELGFNLRIVHRDTDMTNLLADFVALDMPEEYVTRLAEAPELTKVVHLVARLQQMVEWEGKSRLLVGFAPEAVQTHIEKKDPMGFRIPRGQVFLGHEAGAGHEVGETVEILGKQFEVGQILPAHGRRDEDIAIIMHLADAQEVLRKPGKISEILALGCKCKTVDRVEEIREQLEAVLPEARVMELRLAAIARDDQRKLVTEHHRQRIDDYKQGRQQIVDRITANRAAMIEREAEGHAKILAFLASVNTYLTPLLVLVSGVWVGLLAWSNVQERRTEIGLLRALGKGTLDIAGLFLGKALLLGLLGGLVGCGLGFMLARLAGNALEVAPQHFVPSLPLLAATLVGAPLIAAMASYLPTLKAVTQDPAVVLMEE